MAVALEEQGWVGYDCSFTWGLQLVKRRNDETPVTISRNLCFVDNWIKYSHLFRSLLSWFTECVLDVMAVGLLTGKAERNCLISLLPYCEYLISAEICPLSPVSWLSLFISWCMLLSRFNWILSSPVILEFLSVGVVSGS